MKRKSFIATVFSIFVINMTLKILTPKMKKASQNKSRQLSQNNELPCDSNLANLILKINKKRLLYRLIAKQDIYSNYSSVWGYFEQKADILSRQ